MDRGMKCSIIDLKYSYKIGLRNVIPSYLPVSIVGIYEVFNCLGKVINERIATTRIMPCIIFFKLLIDNSKQERRPKRLNLLIRTSLFI